MEKVELLKLKKQLPRNYTKLIKAKTEKSNSAIFKTFHEGSSLIVMDVVDAALEIVEEQKAKQSERARKLSQLN